MTDYFEKKMYFRTVKPLVTEEEYMVTEEIVKKFGDITGIGTKLQQKLEVKKNTTDNWVSLTFYGLIMQDKDC